MKNQIKHQTHPINHEKNKSSLKYIQLTLKIPNQASDIPDSPWINQIKPQTNPINLRKNQIKPQIHPITVEKPNQALGIPNLPWKIKPSLKYTQLTSDISNQASDTTN